MNDIYPRAYKRLQQCFWSLWTGLIATVVLMEAIGDPTPKVVVYLVGRVLLLICFFGYLYNLQVLLSAANKKAGLWVFLTFLFTLIGCVVSFIWVRKIAKEQRWTGSTASPKRDGSITGMGRLRAWLQNTNGWQRLWCLLVVLTFLGLFFGLAVGKAEIGPDGESKYLGSLLCRYNGSYLVCNVRWVFLWMLAMAGLYALGRAIAWIVDGFRRKE